MLGKPPSVRSGFRVSPLCPQRKEGKFSLFPETRAATFPQTGGWSKNTLTLERKCLRQRREEGLAGRNGDISDRTRGAGDQRRRHSSAGVTQTPSQAQDRPRVSCFQASWSSCWRWNSLGQKEHVAKPDQSVTVRRGHRGPDWGGNARRERSQTNTRPALQPSFEKSVSPLSEGHTHQNRAASVTETPKRKPRTNGKREMAQQSQF